MIMNSEMLVDEREKTEERDLPAHSDPLKIYLAEISKHPVLSREEEREVALLVYEQKDQHAAQKLAMSNVKLVVKIALEYYNTYINVLDLIQEGNVGLLHAVKKYNPYMGTKFSTYAAFWIRAYILKHIMDSWSLVKVGTTQGQRRLFFRLNREKRKLESQGIHPSPELLASTISVKVEEINSMQERLSCTDVSLDATIYDGSDDTVMDTLHSDDDVEEIVSERQKSLMFSRKLTEFKDTLDDRDTFILNHRVMTDEPMTLDTIGNHFNISRERVRQVELRMIKNLKIHFRGEAAAFGMLPDRRESQGLPGEAQRPYLPSGHGTTVQGQAMQ
jgi:RNA polymerase sigma-32 factor